MSEEKAKDVTRLLGDWMDGDQNALEALMPLVYDELKRMARRYMQSQPSGHTLQTTALIHEAYLKLSDNPDKRFVNRAHFFGVAAQAMRHILVDHARARQTGKRGGPMKALALDEAATVSLERNAELIALDDALSSLAVADPRKARVVELRYFGGLTVEETAVVLGVSGETVHRDWRFAKLWLLRELSAE